MRYFLLAFFFLQQTYSWIDYMHITYVPRNRVNTFFDNFQFVFDLQVELSWYYGESPRGFNR
jgi:hypothetical protein